ncbi:MAG: ParB/RepB/Spo0J family partition protein [Candidatus Omnitrophica bacterium]|nr:ParB/RepB/Spo0J family partition protein [Candidatus Omnitrophota bacterium]
MERKVLGKGLSALMPDKSLVDKDQVIKIKLTKIKHNRYQPRKEIDPKKLEELIASIKAKGVIQPVLVRTQKDGYELIAGERRLKAVSTLGFTEIPAIVKDVEDAEALQLALIENIQREELNPLEEAQAYEQLISEFGYTQEQIAKMVGKDPSSVSNMLRLLRLPKEIQDALRRGMITMGHARTILGLRAIEEQGRFFRQAISQRLSVRELEQMVSKRTGRIRRKKQGVRDPHIIDLEHQVQLALGTKVRIVPGRKRGRIILEYYSLSDLDRLIRLLKNTK